MPCFHIPTPAFHVISETLYHRESSTYLLIFKAEAVGFLFLLIHGNKKCKQKEEIRS